MNFTILLGKELREQWRTYRLLVTVLVFVAFAGLMSPIVAKMAPELFNNHGHARFLARPCQG